MQEFAERSTSADLREKSLVFSLRLNHGRIREREIIFSLKFEVLSSKLLLNQSLHALITR
jgi:hypothetical protein